MSKLKLLTVLSTLGGAGLLPLFAQADADSASAASDDDTVKMEKFEVNEVPIEQRILPTSRPFNSVFGTNDNILDVPRNVTIISRQQLSDINISDVRDFSKLTSSSYTTTNFGAPANPSIRGQSADLFINGTRARITSNGNGLPLDFNSVESVNIVKGPATAVQGTSMYVGGFIDLITKRPYFDTTRASVSYTIGSYNVNKWTFDIGGPISPTLAYRFSYSGEDSEGYWYDFYRKTQSLYGAITWKPNDRYELFVNGQVFYADYTENWGVNRVTQDLIDNGNYITGVNDNAFNADGSMSDPQNAKYVLGGSNSIAWGPTVKLDRRTRLLNPSNNSIGREFNLQAIQTLAISPDLTLKNTTFGSYTRRDTLSTYYYSEIIDPSWFAENRTEFIFSLGKAAINAGLDVRYQRTKAYDDYFFEPANVWDLTKDHNYIDVYLSDAFNAFPGYPVPGHDGRFAYPGVWNGDTNDSYGLTVGPFVQSTITLTDQLIFVAGGRYDYMHAHVREPLLPPYQEDNIDVAIPNVNGSLIFKPTDASSVYVTYNYSENTSGAVGNGGGITGWNDAATQLDTENFHQPSKLFEVGSKYAFLGNKLFVNLAYFDQTRTAKSTSSTVIQKFESKGFEIEANYQPNKNFYATASYSYIDAQTTAGFQYGLFGNVVEMAPGNSNPTVPIGTVVRVSGLPQHSFNSLASYTLDNGLGFSANLLVTGEINNNLAGTLVIPTQYNIDASVFYRYKKYDFRLTVLNVTDEENWAAPNSVYGNGSILALPGTEVQFTVKYKF